MSAYFVPVVYAILQLVTYFLVGYMLRIRNVYSMDFFNQLSRFVVRVALPLYYFVGVAGTDLASIRSSIIFPVSAVLLTIVSAAISAMVLAPIRGLGARTNGGSGWRSPRSATPASCRSSLSRSFR